MDVLTSQKRSTLRGQLTLAITLVVVFAIALITLLSNVLVARQFERYVERQQATRTRELVALLGQQYDADTGQFDVDALHTIGMDALYQGYIVKVLDASGATAWDAQHHDMSQCRAVMREVQMRMDQRMPQVEGDFQEERFALRDAAGVAVGSAAVTFYGPFFLTDADVSFLDTLNSVLVAVGALSLLVGVAVAFVLARRIARPVTAAAEGALRIAAGGQAALTEPVGASIELHELVGSLNALSAGLERTDELRRRAAGDVAHELRTPLAALSAQIEGMVDGVWEADAARLSALGADVARLSALVRDLERLAAAESLGAVGVTGASGGASGGAGSSGAGSGGGVVLGGGSGSSAGGGAGGRVALSWADVDVAALAVRVVASFEAAAHAADLTLTVDASLPVIVRSDADRLAQVLTNLLANALHYTPVGGDVTVTVTPVRDDISGVPGAVITVADTGVGIADADLPYLFERFYRADEARARATGGSGIGLAIARSLTEALGGYLSVESEVGKGSIFTVSL
ncbi:MAG: hypothetical protein LBJ07_00255 [Actinomycetes bacterium]|jgi:signal transduction histidine kinase|nr:hypothetical protein [Actinomycetes bacterium]